MESKFSSKSILVAGLVFALLMTMALGGRIITLDYDGEPKKIFQFSGKVYDDYLRLLESYPGAESTLVVVVIGDVFSKENFDALGEFEALAGKIEGITQLTSVRSLPQVQSALIDPFTMEPVDDVDQSRLAEIKLSIDSSTNYFTNEPATAQLLLFGLNDSVLQSSTALAHIQSQLDRLLQQSLRDVPLEYHFTGLPAMKAAVDKQLSEDTILINVIGSVAATLVAFILFRSFTVLAVLATGPALGVVWTLGFMQWIGDDISVLTSVLPPLVFVLGYTNVAHIIFALLRGDSQAGIWDTSFQATSKVIKACFLSSLTTGIGFSSLMFSDSSLIYDFGFYSAVGCAFMFLAVISVTPALIVFFRLEALPDKQRILSICAKPLERLANWVQTQFNKIVWFGIVAFIAMLGFGLQNHSDYRFLENFSKGNAFYQSLQRTDEYFSGSISANVLVEWNQNATNKVRLSQLIAAEEDVDAQVSEVLGDVRIASLASLVNALPRGQVTEFRQLALAFPESVSQRFVNLSAGSSQMVISVSDEGSRQLIPKFDELQQRLRLLEAEHPQFKFSLTGIAPLSAYATNRNVGELVMSLGIALVVIFIVISISLRSVMSGLICMLPNMLPLTGLAALLMLFGQPLYFSNLLVFTICLGIAVDDTVHFVIRYRQVLAKGGSHNEALRETISQIGLVLIFTTLILSAGFFSLLFSGIGVVSLMGKLAITALCLALISDLVFLPALISKRAEGKRN